MYIDDFESFYQAAEQLYRSRPLDTRYCIKYRHKEGKLVLKVTDDVTCLKYKTDQQADLKKLERLTCLFCTLMARGDVPPEELVPVDTQPSSQQQQPQKQQQPPGSSKKNRRKG